MIPLPEEIRLWPGDAPGSAGLDLTPELIERSDDPLLPDRIRTGVLHPSLMHWQADKPNGTAVLLVPGGGYQRVVQDKEGSDIARWLCGLGVSVFQLNYRLPAEGHAERSSVPLQDGQRAMRLIRARAVEWGVPLKCLGVMAFSAGGHLAATLATRHAQPAYVPVDAIDKLDARPDFMLLGYPVISMQAGVSHAISRTKLLGDNPDAAEEMRWSADQHVNASVPPTFLIHAEDDTSVPPENSLRFHKALLAAGVSAELHVFSQGGRHGFGLRQATRGSLRLWPQLAEAWMRDGGWL